MKSLFETLSEQSKRHADLINAGIQPEQAASIAFNPDNEAVQQVEDEMLTIGLKMAFMYGMRYQMHVQSGIVLTDQEEALKEAIRVIKETIS